MAQKQKKEGVFVYLPVDLATKLRVRAAESRESISGIAEKAIAQYLKKPRPKGTLR